MMAIKIQCGCGQKYSFDIEPVAGHMPSAIACPACGADGTAAANTAISRSLVAEPVASGRGLPGAARLAATPAHSAAPRRATLLPGQSTPEQACHEARAKILWGDEAQEVIKFLMGQGYPYEEASGMVKEMLVERAATIRSDGIGKICTGVPMMLVPVVGWFAFARVGYLPLKLYALLVMVGLYGGWRVLKGSIMAISPKSEPGSVTDK